MVTIPESNDYKMEAFPMTLVYDCLGTSGTYLLTLHNFTLCIFLYFLPLGVENYLFLDFSLVFLFILCNFFY